ncbi:MAG TPA: hypothetical protein VGO47_08925, partial [Chlamydiales bacterium]|nr:hypothetical protein [Chlamydiales bacterium]
ALDLQNKVKNPRRNWETHLDPVFRPQFIRDMSSGENLDYNLKTLAKYAGKPRRGLPMTIPQDNLVFKQHADTLAGPGCWLVRRKDIVARNLAYHKEKEFLLHLNQETGARYELENPLLDLATDAAVRHVFKGERHFGDFTGIEECWTFARSRDRVHFGNESYPATLGGFNRSTGLALESFSDVTPHEHTGVAIFRKF